MTWNSAAVWLFLLTNNFDLPALTIAHLYQARWKDKTVFQMDQTALRIKAFTA